MGVFALFIGFSVRIGARSPRIHLQTPIGTFLSQIYSPRDRGSPRTHSPRHYRAERDLYPISCSQGYYTIEARTAVRTAGEYTRTNRTRPRV